GKDTTSKDIGLNDNKKALLKSRAFFMVKIYNIPMHHLTRRFLIFIIILIGMFIILFSYFFMNSRAGSLTTNEKYMQSLQEASRGKKLAGNQTSSTLHEQPATYNTQPSNLFEELIFQIKALFKVQ